MGMNAVRDRIGSGVAFTINSAESMLSIGVGSIGNFLGEQNRDQCQRSNYGTHGYGSKGSDYSRVHSRYRRTQCLSGRRTKSDDWCWINVSLGVDSV